MAYLDPMRFALSGDPARAQLHVRTARVAALGLIQLNGEAGVTVGRRQLNLPDGTKINIVQAGMDVSASIEAPGAPETTVTTLAYVAMAGASPRIYIVDVELQKVVKNISGLGNISGITAHPTDQFLYAINLANQLIRVDLKAVTAVGINVGAQIADVFISEDGSLLHVRVLAEGIPGAGGFYGALWTFDAKTLDIVSTLPNMLFSNRTYYGAAHPKFPHLLYLPVFGDGDGDGDPITNDHSNANYCPEAIEVYDYTSGTHVAGDTFHEFYVASARGPKAFAFLPDGSRGFAVSTRPDNYVGGGGSSVPVSTVIEYATEGGTLVRGAEYYVGVELSAGIATSRDGQRVFVADHTSENARVLVRDGDIYVFDQAFPRCPATADAGALGRSIQLGPKAADPDNRMFFLNTTTASLWAFNAAASTPDKKVTLPGPETPQMFALKRATRRIERKAA
jgi:DNA-binding beta-propeller fold protein YncE